MPPAQLHTLAVGARQQINGKAQVSPAAGLSNVTLFLTNLRLLDLDRRSDWPEITPQTFSTKDAQQNQKNRVKAVEWTLYRLFELWDREETRDKLQPFFPPLEPLQSLNLRAALFRCLSELKKNGVLGRDAILRKTMLDECKGERFEEVILAFSTAVVKRHIVGVKDNYGEHSIVHRLTAAESLTPAEQDMIPVLIVAHKASLAKSLRKRAELRSKYEDFGNLLDLKLRQITRRDEQIKLAALEAGQTSDISGAQSEKLRGRLQDNWVGDAKLLEVLMRGDDKKGHDPVLSASFNEAWDHVTNGTVGDLEDAASKGVLEDLSRRVRNQQIRLERWKQLKDRIPSDEGLSTKSSPRKPANVLKDSGDSFALEFDAHESLTLDLRSPTKGPKLVVEQMERPVSTRSTEYGRIIASMRSELSAVGKSRSQGGRGWREQKSSWITRDIPPKAALDDHGESSSGEEQLGNSGYEEEAAQATPEGSSFPVHQEVEEKRDSSESSRESDEAPSSHQQLQRVLRSSSPPASDGLVLPSSLPPTESIPQPPKSSRLSLLDVEGQELLAEQIVASVTNAQPSPEKPVRTLAERTRMSMAFSRLPDELPPHVKEPHPEKLNAVKTKTSDPTEESDPHANLIERTRRSMSFAPTTRAPRKSAIHVAPKKSFPTNQFETPKKRGSLGMVGEDGKESTPREELFNQEADYASVFKSRPKIKLSPQISPTIPMGGLNDLNELEEGSEESEEELIDEERWKGESSPLGRMGGR